MKIIPFDQVKSNEWDELCDSSSQAWLFHRSDWVRLEVGYFFFENHSFALHDGDRLVAIQPLYKGMCGLGSWSEVLIHSGMHRHTGLALLDGLDAGVAKAVRTAAMHRISEVAASTDADRIQLNCQNLAPQNLGVGRIEIPFWVSYFGYSAGLGIGPSGIAPALGVTNCWADQIIELQNPEDYLFSHLESSCRRAIRKAQAAELSLCEGGEDAVTDYYHLAKLSAVRSGETLAPNLYYQDIFSAFQEHGQCKVLFVLSNGQKVAALWLLIYKGSAHFLGGVSDPEFLKLRVNDFLHWSAIVWAKQEKLSYYRLGPIFPELPKNWPVVQVSKFKGKFGGKSFTTIQGSFFRWPEKYLGVGRTQLENMAKMEDGQS